jgi:hypothetical protein
MFRTAMCPSSGELIVSIRQVWMELQFHPNLHTRRSSTQSYIYQMSYWYNYFSWWWTHSCPKHVENGNKHTWRGIVRQVGYWQGYFLLFICALFNEFPRFSWSGDVGLLTANFCFIYVLHCSYLSQCRIWNYRCIALGVYHNRESEITTVLHYVSFLPLFAYVLTYGVPVRLNVKHSANCAVASHSLWCPSCRFVWIPFLSAPLPCCVFLFDDITITTSADFFPKSQAKLQIYHLFPPPPPPPVFFV